MLFATDLGGSTQFDTATGGQGNFIGVSLSANVIQRGLFLFVTPQSVNGFTLDDLTYARVSANGSTIPEPRSLLLFVTGAAAIFARPLTRKIIAARR